MKIRHLPTPRHQPQNREGLCFQEGRSEPMKFVAFDAEAEFLSSQFETGAAASTPA